MAIGEIGLTGDLRSIRNAEKIVREAARLGFSQIIMPKKNAARLTELPGGVKVTGVNSLREAIQIVQQPLG